ncbi:tetratricopeptide repeat protein [Maribellus sp. CM-23]|uniref:DUF6340 family protein n=1 Tax=Maribellus sp. CM-23 TaxID=2781026 RepID=UPI001F22025D|nr:DUF6340 family protein [Maribellus sp. CM-23]MCE4564213.1 tetratricopeptide repeat protein [Maribellus sp. CM-23]
MSRSPLILMLSLFVTALLEGCTTFYNVSLVKIEIIQPSEIILPSEYRKLAVRYNNTNIAFNPELINYNVLGKAMSDTTNLDSVASRIYYEYFLSELSNQDFLDTIIELRAADYSATSVKDTLSFSHVSEIDTSDYDSYVGIVNSYVLSQYFKMYPTATKNKTSEKILDTEFGLYTSDKLKEIADLTGADFFLSLDHFFTRNEIDTNEFFVEGYYKVTELAEVNALWSIYDLNKNLFHYQYLHKNPITWEGECIFLQNALNVVPPRRDAVLNSADISGTEFAHMLIPHWMEVQRMYYKSGHVDLKQTNELIKDGQWLEAAKHWKKNISNPNKRIAAKCMFNMGLVCEMQNDIEAAIDWVVQSYHVFKEKDEMHAYNCKSYLNILAARKLDFKILDKQMQLVEQQ